MNRGPYVPDLSPGSILNRVGDLLSRKAPEPPPPQRPTNETKAIAGSVQFAGPPLGTYYGGEVNPDADKLTRGIAAATSCYAFSAISYRARTFAEPPLGIWIETEEGHEPLDHELDRLLRDPSPDWDMGELLSITSAYVDVTGAALWKKDLDVSDRIGRFVPFNGEQFTTRASGERWFGSFHLTNRRGTRDSYPPEEVVHFRELNPGSLRNNLAKLDVALAMLQVGHDVHRTVRNFMKRAMFPGGVVSPDPEWNPDDPEWEKYKGDVAAWFGGPANAGEPLILLGGTTFSQSAMPLDDILPDDLLDRIEATIGSVFGIPPVILGWLVGLKNSPWSQMEEARRMTYEDTIDPLWTTFEKRLSRQLLSREDRDRGIVVRFDRSAVRALEPDLQRRAETVFRAREYWTVNESRVATGQETFPDDDPRGELVVVEFVNSSKPAPPTLPMPTGDELEEADDDEEDEETEDELEDEGDEEDEDEAELEEAAAALGLELKGATKAQVAAILFDVGTKAAESTWQREIAQELDRQRRDILRLIGKHVRVKSHGRKDLDPDTIATFLQALTDLLRTKIKERMRKVVSGLVLSVSTSAVRNAASQVGVPFAVLQEGLTDFVEAHANFLASVMGETTGKRVAETVQASLTEGESLRGLRSRLNELPAFDRNRAQLTARTETTRAWNGAQRRQISSYSKRTGATTYKEWVAVLDGDTRPEHEDLDGTELKIDEVFSNGLKEPGEPNCRCTLTYRIALPGDEDDVEVENDPG